MPENMKSLNGYRFDAEKLNGKSGSEYASAESLSQLKNDLTAEQTARANADQALAKDIGDAWASGTTYAVGGYCISGNQLYKCKTAHTAGSAFNADYWNAVSVAGEIGYLEFGKANIYRYANTNSDNITTSITQVMNAFSSVSFFVNVVDWATGDAHGAVGVFSKYIGGYSGVIGSSRIISDPDNIIANVAVSFENQNLTVQLNSQYSYIRLYYIY